MGKRVYHHYIEAECSEVQMNWCALMCRDRFINKRIVYFNGRIGKAASDQYRDRRKHYKDELAAAMARGDDEAVFKARGALWQLRRRKVVKHYMRFADQRDAAMFKLAFK